MKAVRESIQTYLKEGGRKELIILQSPVTQIEIYLDSFPGDIQYVLSFSFSVAFSVTSDNYILSAVLQFTPEYRTHQLILWLRGQYYLA